MRASEFIAESFRRKLNFDEIYGRYLKVTDNDGDPNKEGFSLVTPLNGASWNWTERPEFKEKVKRRLNQPGWLGDYKYQQIIDAMAGNKFDPAKHLATENFADGQDKISFKVQKGKNKFATTLTVNNKPAGVYQYNADTGRSIAEIIPEFQSQGLGKILVLHAIYTAAQLGMDFQEDESRTAAYDHVLDSLSSNGYIVDDDGYWYVTGEGEQFLNTSLNENFADGKKPEHKDQASNDKINEFLDFVKKYLGLDELPEINFLQTSLDSTFGHYGNGKIEVVVAGRHQNDVFRTLAHELVHYKQELDGRINDESGETGSTEENEANSEAGVIMRHYNHSKQNALEENFADGRNPQDKGDSRRHGIPKGATIAQLKKIRSSDTASPRKKQLAHWQINMRQGKKK